MHPLSLVVPTWTLRGLKACDGETQGYGGTDLLLALCCWALRAKSEPLVFSCEVSIVMAGIMSFLNSITLLSLMTRSWPAHQWTQHCTGKRRSTWTIGGTAVATTIELLRSTNLCSQGLQLSRKIVPLSRLWGSSSSSYKLLKIRQLTSYLYPPESPGSYRSYKPRAIACCGLTLYPCPRLGGGNSWPQDSCSQDRETICKFWDRKWVDAAQPTRLVEKFRSFKSYVWSILKREHLLWVAWLPNMFDFHATSNDCSIWGTVTATKIGFRDQMTAPIPWSLKDYPFWFCPVLSTWMCTWDYNWDIALVSSPIR